MKNFVKMTLATVLGLFIFGFVAMFLMFGAIGALASMGETTPEMPKEAVLQINWGDIILSEQTQEMDPMAILQGGGSTEKSSIGIYDAINAINKAAVDPAVKFIYMKPDAASGGIAHIEEFRTALENFRTSGKAIISFIENPTNAGYYLASVSDKVYMSSYEGGMNSFSGLSSQMMFLKDVLDKLGINIQLIRHGKYKSAGEMYIKNSPSPENLEQNQVMISSVWNNWVEKIAASREISISELNAMLNNLELNFPDDFLSKGLVDELYTRDQLDSQLCTLFGVEEFKDVKAIDLSDYAKIKKTVNFKAEKKVAVIYTSGSIVDGNAKKDVAGDRFARILRNIRNDESINAVVLRVDSPGGSVLASEKIKNGIELLQQKGIPVIASYANYAASGGYWISAGCDKIYSNASTLTGSIGVFSMIPDASKLIKDKIEVGITQVNSNSHSDMYGLMRPLDQAEIDYMQASVDRIYTKFTTLVAEGREMELAAVDEIAQGRVWTGSDALGIGLVDEIGTIEDAINYAALSIEGVSTIEDVQIEEYPKPQTTAEMLMEAFGGNANIFAGTQYEHLASFASMLTSDRSGKVYARLPYEIVIR